MKSIIRNMTLEDQESVIEMMRVFYASPAVLSNGSEDIFLNDIENCVNENPYVEGFIFEDSKDIQGYAMVARAFQLNLVSLVYGLKIFILKKSIEVLELGVCL